jgi:haloacid dehalogenase superfamily, subfamily IA, variant 1 with third motif having Dx(3-4)D or Dx(3-4)E
VTESEADAATRAHSEKDSETNTVRQSNSEPPASADNSFVVLFDMDGVILEGRGADSIVHERAFEDILAEREWGDDWEQSLSQSHRSALEQYEYTEEFVTACEAIDVDPVAFYAAREERSAQRISDRIADGRRGVYADIDALKTLDNETTLGLVSNNYHPTVQFVVDHFEIDRFDHVRGRDLGVDGFRRRKPDPHYLEETLDALGADSGVYVGDRGTDVIAAHRAGLESVFLRRSHNDVATLDRTPTASINDLRDLPRVLEQIK